MKFLSICNHLLDTCLGHALEALCVSLMNLWNLEVVFLELVDQLGSIKLAVASASLDNLGLLIQGKVLPREVWANVLLEKRKNLVVGDGTWVGEVVDPGFVVLRKKNGGWEEVVENSVGVGNINNALILGDLGDEVAAVQVIADWHSQSQDEHLWVGFHDLLNVSLGLGVERAIEIGLISLKVPWTSDGVLLIVCVDAAGGKDGEVDLLQETAVSQVEGADDVASDGLLLVVLAPIDIRTSGAASTVEDVGWLDSLKLSDDSLAVLHAHCGSGDSLALALEKSLEMASDPSLASPDEEGLRLHGSVGSHC